MSLTNCECSNPQQHDCLYCVLEGCAEEIFKRIKNDHEGEMDEEAYDEELSECLHEEVDECATNMSQYDSEALVESFGTLKALKLYSSVYGGASELLNNKEHQINRVLLFAILRENVQVSYRAYNNYNLQNA